MGQIGLGLGFCLVRVGIWIKLSEGFYREIKFDLPPRRLFINYYEFYMKFCSNRTKARFDKL